MGPFVGFALIFAVIVLIVAYIFLPLPTDKQMEEMFDDDDF